jgi:hypothetical protein
MRVRRGSHSAASPGVVLLVSAVRCLPLKDKLGTRSLPSYHTRLDCMLGAAAGYRRGTLEAIHHARHRSAFGAPLADQRHAQRIATPKGKLRSNCQYSITAREGRGSRAVAGQPLHSAHG